MNLIRQIRINERMKLEDSCCINCGQRMDCDSYKNGIYSDECRFYFPEEILFLSEEDE